MSKPQNNTKAECSRVSVTLCLSHSVTEISHLYSLRDFWRPFGLCRAAAHSDCCFFAPCTNILTYLLTYPFTSPTAAKILACYAYGSWQLPCKRSMMPPLFKLSARPTATIMLSLWWLISTPNVPATDSTVGGIPGVGCSDCVELT